MLVLLALIHLAGATTSVDNADPVADRQRLLMDAEFKVVTATPPEKCSIAEVDAMLLTMYVGDEAQRQATLETLRNIDERCPNWLVASLTNTTKNSDLQVPGCHAMRLYQNTRDLLPSNFQHSVGLALLNMVNSKSWGSYYPFLRQYENGSDVLEMDDSENHDINKKSQQSVAIEILASLPGPHFGPDVVLADGFKVSQHREAWAAYWRSYFRMQALHGINVETGSSVYAKCFLDGLTCLHDLTMDGGLQMLVSDYLQLYFADAATEFIFQPSCEGFRGGAKARTKADHRLFDPVVGDHIYGVAHMGWQLGWFANSSDITKCDSLYSNDTSQNVLQNPWYPESTSCFRPLPQIRAIAQRDAQSFMRSSYRRGRASAWTASFYPLLPTCYRDGSIHSSMVAPPACNGNVGCICYYLNYTYPAASGASFDSVNASALQYGILRLTHVTPQYVLGTTDFAEDCDFASIAVQNVWMGAVFAASHTDVIGIGGVNFATNSTDYPVGTPIFSIPSGVTVPGASVIKRYTKSQADSLYFSFSSTLVHTLHVTPEGWYCVQDSAAASFGCVRPLGNEGTDGVSEGGPQRHHHHQPLIYTLVRDPWSPIIVQMSSSDSYDGNFTAFVAAVQATKLQWDNSTGARHLQYTSLLGNTIEMYGRSIEPNRIDGHVTQAQCTSGPRHSASTPTYMGPFVTGGGAAGSVTIHSAVGSAELDFTAGNPLHRVNGLPSPTCADAHPGWYGNG